MSRSETEKERVLLVYQTNIEVVGGRFPVSRDLALEMAALMAQVTEPKIFFDVTVLASNQLTAVTVYLVKNWSEELRYNVSSFVAKQFFIIKTW